MKIIKKRRQRVFNEMSWSLVKRGLDLLDDDVVTSGSGDSKEFSQRGKGRGVNTRRHGIQKIAKQKKRIQQEKKEIRSQLIQREIRNALKDYQQKLPGDSTKKNLKLLKKLDGKIKAKDAKTITKQHEKGLQERITKADWTERVKKKKKSETSAFTDEDFEKMNDVWLRLNQ